MGHVLESIESAVVVATMSDDRPIAPAVAPGAAEVDGVVTWFPGWPANAHVATTPLGVGWAHIIMLLPLPASLPMRGASTVFFVSTGGALSTMRPATPAPPPNSQPAHITAKITER